MKRNAFYVLLLVGIAIRVVMLLRYDLFQNGEFDSQLAADGMVGLVAKHLMEGGAAASSPVAFDPRLLDAYLAALSFSGFGVGLVQLRLLPFFMSLVVPVLVYRFVYVHYSVAAARWATVLTVVAPVHFLRLNQQVHGGYAGHLILLFAGMLLFWRFFIMRERRAWMGFVIGAGAVLSVWVNPRMLWYVGIMLLLLGVQFRDRRGWNAVLLGLALVSLLIVGRSIDHRPEIVTRQLSKAWQVSADGQAPQRIYGMVQGMEKLTAVFGVPLRSGSGRGGRSGLMGDAGTLTGIRSRLWFLPLIVFGIALAACRPRRGRSSWGPIGSDQILGLFVLVTLIVGWTRHGSLASVYPLSAIMAGVLCSRLVGARRRFMVTAVAALLVFHTTSWADTWMRARNRDTSRTKVLLAKLVELELDRCFSVAPLYDVVFASNEHVIISPLGDYRFSSYAERVSHADRFCYIFGDDEVRDRRHLGMLSLLEQTGGIRQETSAGDYTILHDFKPGPVLDAADLAKLRRLGAGRGTMGEDSPSL